MKRLFEDPMMDIVNIKFEAVANGDNNDTDWSDGTSSEEEW